MPKQVETIQRLINEATAPLKAEINDLKSVIFSNEHESPFITARRQLKQDNSNNKAKDIKDFAPQCNHSRAFDYCMCNSTSIECEEFKNDLKYLIEEIKPTFNPTNLESRIRNLENDVGDVPDGSDLRSMIGNVTDGSSLQEQVTSNAEDISTLQDQVGDVTDGTNLQGQVSTLQAQVGDVPTGLFDQSLQEQVTTNADDISNLEAQVGNVTEDTC